MPVADNLKRVTSELPEGVRLVAVSKFHPAEAVMEAYDAGQRIFGESRADELTAKRAACPDDIEWHFIGHLQSNKVGRVVEAADVIQSIDSVRLLRRVDDAAARLGRRLKVFLQVHVAAEDTKFGFTPEELDAEITPELLAGLRATEITGVMGMATNTDDTDRVRADFRAIRAAFELLKPRIAGLRDISMGMTDDHLIAIEEGSTMVRIGTEIFGPRQY